MRIRRLATVTLVGVTFLSLLKLAAPEGLDSEAGPRDLVISLRGTVVAVHSTYLPAEDQGRYVDARTHDVVRLRFEWPSMRPFHEQENLAPPVRYRNELAVSIGPSGTMNAAERRAFLSGLANEFRAAHVANSSRFGLERTSLPDSASSPFGKSDVLTHFGATDTMIACSPDSEPEPGTLEAERQKASGELVRIPYCTHQFFVSDLPRATVRVRYRRIHLHEWKHIQKNVSDFISMMITEGEKKRSGT